MVGRKRADDKLSERVQGINEILEEHIFFSTQRTANYEKFMPLKEFKKAKEYYPFYLNAFMSVDWFSKFAGLGNRC